MADLDAICRGIAALLKDVLPGTGGQVSAFPLEEGAIHPPCLQVWGPGPEGVDEVGMTDPDTTSGVRYEIIIEGWFGGVGVRGSHETLRRLLSTLALHRAVISDTTSDGCLFSRLADDGTVTTDEDAPAAEAIKMLAYLGSTRFPSHGGDMLLATWTVEVWA